MTEKYGFGDIEFKDSPKNIEIINKNTLSKYINLDKVNSIITLNSDLKLGNNFSYIRLSNTNGFIIPNNVEFNLDGSGNIANKKIYWDKSTLKFCDNIIPITSIKGEDIKKLKHSIVNECVDKIKNINKGDKGTQGNCGIDGKDGISVISSIDSFNVVCNDENITTQETDISLHIYAYKGNEALQINISASSDLFDIDIINEEYHNEVKIHIKKGLKIINNMDFIKYEINILGHYTIAKYLYWNKLHQYKPMVNITQPIPKPKNNKEIQPFRHMAYVSNGCVFVDDGIKISPHKHVLYANSTDIYKSPKWYYKKGEKWEYINNNDNTLTINADDVKSYGVDIIYYKVEYSPNEIAYTHCEYIPNTIIPQECINNTSKKSIQENDFISYNFTSKNSIPLTIGGIFEDTITQPKISNIIKLEDTKISLNPNGIFDCSFTNKYYKKIYISSDRISTEDYPLTSKLISSKKYILDGSLDLGILTQCESNIELKITTNIISNKKIISTNTHTDNILVKSNTIYKLPFENLFLSDDKTIRIEIICEFISNSDKIININIKPTKLNLFEYTELIEQSVEKRFNICDKGIDMKVDKDNFLTIINDDNGILFNYNTSNRKTALLPLIYFTKWDNGITYYGGVGMDSIKLNYEKNIITLSSDILDLSKTLINLTPHTHVEYNIDKGTDKIIISLKNIISKFDLMLYYTP